MIIIGVSSVLKDIPNIRTEPIDLSQIKTSGSIETGVILPAASVKLSPEFPKKIKIVLETGENSEKVQDKKTKKQ